MATSIGILVPPFAVVAIELRPLSRKVFFSREEREAVYDDNNNNNNNNNEKLREDERRVRRRHSELSRSGAPLFIPHVMPCGRTVEVFLRYLQR